MASSCSVTQWTKYLGNIPPLTFDSVDAWAKKSAKIPLSQQKKGYSNFIEGYVHDVEVQVQQEGDDGCKIRAKAYPSMRKNNPPYKLMVSLTDAEIIHSSQCECKAGNGHCSHIIGLLYMVCHFQKLGLQSVPAVHSKTSLPQTWHVPSRTEGLTPKPVDSLNISKVKPVQQPTKRRRVSEGLVPKVYCPVPTPIPWAPFTASLLEQLQSIKSNAQITKVLPQSQNTPTVSTKFGPVPLGSPISYQQRLELKDGDIIKHPSHPTFPTFALPPLESTFSYVLRQAEQEMFLGLHVTEEQALEVEVNTREQSHSKLWHDVRKNRITSSVFKQVCSRQGDHDSLALRLLTSKGIQTSAMKFGIEHEPEAAKLYSEVTGNNVYLSGFVINPSAPHLGASPDRKVYDPNSETPHGLLEIKCPDKDSFYSCPYLKKQNNGTYKLKSTHSYYYQVMGQMGLTGEKWCDFLVKCRDDYHLERIAFNEDLWCSMKTALDSFFFLFHLPQMCKN